MVKTSLIGVLVLLSYLVQAQVAPNKYWIEFTDKLNSNYSLNEPQDYLSERAIARRCNQNIAIDWLDVPVNEFYVQSVASVQGVSILYSSKWFNAVAINLENEEYLVDILNFPFVKGYRSVQGFTKPEFDERQVQFKRNKRALGYGQSYHQMAMLNGHLLHQDGFTGNGIQIGIMDGGFALVDEMLAFQSLFSENRVLGTYDFVGLQQDVFHSSTHGTSVLSIIASMWPDSLMGSAFAASYYLFLVENVASEYRLEEHNWIAGAEYADSAGVDVLNTSLGYTQFDDSLQNYSYADMDGVTAMISRAGDIAASRGILVVNSAGNSGANSWYYIGAPADAASVLAIGAVRADSSVTAFSSRGPSFDGRVKPNVCAQGQWTVFAGTDNTVQAGNGTSFSSPVLAGLAACLWQTNPMATSAQVFNAIEQSAHLYQNPNDSLGYGLPDFQLARILLDGMVQSSSKPTYTNRIISAYPNPFTSSLGLMFSLENTSQIACSVFDITGRMLHQKNYQVMKGETRLELGDAFNGLPSGQYVIRLSFNGRTETVSVQKLK